MTVIRLTGIFLLVLSCHDAPKSNNEDIILDSSGCDWDSDGYLANNERCGGDDCDDDRSDINPGAIEQCNFRDDDCDVEINEGLDCRVYGAEEDRVVLVDPFRETFTIDIDAPPGRWFDIAVGREGELWALGASEVWRLESSGYWAEVASHPYISPSGFCESFGGNFWIIAGRSAAEWSPVVGELRRLEAPDDFFSSGDCVDIKGNLYLTDLSGQPGGDALWRLDGESGIFTSIGLIGKDKVYGLARIEGLLVGLSGDGEAMLIDPQTADSFVTAKDRTYQFVGSASVLSYQNVD